MPTRPNRKTPENDEILEKQLEQLFSDAVLPVFTTVTTLHSTQPAKETRPKASPSRIVQVFDLYSLKQGFRSSWFSRSRWRTALLTIVTATITLTIVVLTSGLLLIKQGRTAQSDAIAAPFRKEVLPAASRTALATTPRAPLVAAVALIATPGNAALIRNASVINATPIAHSATPIAEQATPTPTYVPATNTRTAAPVTPTPTLSPARRVFTATITPVSAWNIGLKVIPTPVSSVPLPNQAINIVLLGSDQRPYETEWRTDVVIVVSVNPDVPSVSMLSIPRDTWLYIPNWTYQRINLADTHGTAVGYPGGGPGLVKATIEYNLGIHVDYYARVDFAGLMRIVDTLGGIDVLLECPVADGFPDDPITEDPSVVTQISYSEPGLFHLDGKHALWLARSRKTTSEFARSHRQHRILQGIWTRANELGFITRLPDLWEELTTAVQTDLSLDDVLWLASIGMQLEPSNIHSDFIDGRYLTAWVTPGGANVLLPHTEAILDALEQHFNPFPSKAPQGFSQVEVWNASGHDDWGLLAADRLVRSGFFATAIRQRDELYEKTTIFDYSHSTKGSPLPLLERLFTASSSHVSIEPGEESGVSFRLIIGADYQPCEWPTSAQWVPTPTPSSTSTGNQ
jgi:LCP family protein required for cell wall assembly